MDRINVDLLVAKTLWRSWRRNRLRLGAAVCATVVGVALVTSIVSVTLSIIDAVRSASGIETVDVDAVVSARSETGMSEDIYRRIAAAPGVDLAAPVLTVNTRIAGAGSSGNVLLAGLTPDAIPIAGRKLFPDELVPPAPDTRGLFAGEEWAESQGLGLGSPLELSSPDGVSRWTITGLVDVPLREGGALAAATLDDVAGAFDREGRIDAVFVRRSPDVSREELDEQLAAIAGSAGSVGPPTSVASPELASFAVIRALLFVTCGVGLFAAAAVLYVCWRLQLLDDRTNIAPLRLSGVGARNMLVGAGALFLPGAALCALVGIPIGIATAHLLRGFAARLATISGLAASPQPADWRWVALAGLVGAVLVAAGALLVTLGDLLRIPAIEAIRGRRSERSDASFSRRLVILFVGAAAIALAGALIRQTYLAFVALPALFVAGFALARTIPIAVGSRMARDGGYFRMVVGRQFAGDAKRTAAAISIFALALTFSLGLGGVAVGVERGIDRSVAAWSAADVYIEPARPGAVLRDQKFSPELLTRVESVEGVAETCPFSSTPIEFGGRLAQLYAWDPERVDRCVDLDIVEGPTGERFWDELASGGVAVSTNFAAFNDVAVGDSVELPTSEGAVRKRIVATVLDFMSDSGIIYGSLSSYRDITQDERLSAIGINVAPDARMGTVSSRLRASLGGYPDAVVWTGTRLHGFLVQLGSQVLAVIRYLGLASGVLALLVAAATITAALATRRRPLGVARLCGAPVDLIEKQLRLESVLVAITSWGISVALGSLLVVVMVRATEVQTGLTPEIVIPWAQVAVGLGFALVAALLASWTPTRRLLREPVIGALGQEE